MRKTRASGARSGRSGSSRSARCWRLRPSSFSAPWRIGGDAFLRLVLLADLVYILVVAALVLREVARVIASRRARSAGSRLHLRLTGVFTTVALVPTILVAVFATITVNMGLEGWFSDRVSTALGNSVDAAVAYQQEHRDDLSRMPARWPCS
jgi:two-component system nitrogen regulation sensor histidine kinase NtrY